MLVVVFSGPPCTGKSTVASKLAYVMGATHLEMDAVRLRLIPNSHTAEDRQVAYRAMHLLAESLQIVRRSVVLDATYGPFSSRRDLAAILERNAARSYLVQCRLDGVEAAKRFQLRRTNAPGHAATDLDEARVTLLANNFPYSNTGCVLDTAMNVDRCVKTVLQYIYDGPEQIDLSEWLRDPGGQRI